MIHSENNSNTVICWIYTIVLNVYHIHIPYYFKEYHGATPLMAKTHYDTMVHVKKTWYHYNRCLKTGTEQLPHSFTMVLQRMPLPTGYTVVMRVSDSNTMVFLIVLNIYHIHKPFYFKALQRIPWYYLNTLPNTMLLWYMSRKHGYTIVLVYKNMVLKDYHVHLPWYFTE